MSTAAKRVGREESQPDLTFILLQSIKERKRGWIAGYASALYDMRPQFGVESAARSARERTAYNEAATKAFAERFGEK